MKLAAVPTLFASHIPFDPASCWSLGFSPRATRGPALPRAPSRAGWWRPAFAAFADPSPQAGTSRSPRPVGPLSVRATWKARSARVPDPAASTLRLAPADPPLRAVDECRGCWIFVVLRKPRNVRMFRFHSLLKLSCQKWK